MHHVSGKTVLFLAFALTLPACGDKGNGGSRGGGEGSNGVIPPPAGNQAPGVALITPSAGATFSAGDPIVVEADISDGDGWVTQVAFFQGSTLLSTVGAFPFRFTWTGAAPGGYSLTAVATDNAGAQVSSLPVSITVNPIGGGPPANQPPSVTLTSPPDGSTFPDGYPATIEAAASDPEGALAGVEFFIGAASLGTITTPPYRVAWTATPSGSHSLRAIATDASGSATASAPASVIVEPAGGPVAAVRPQGLLHGVFFADASIGWIVGEEGRIYKTTDGGLTWAAQNSGTSAALLRVQFLSTTTGWIVGGQGTILKTVDGGSTWTAQTSGARGDLQRLSFVSSSTGWVISFDDVLKTTDGGATWTPQPHGSIAGGLQAVSFITARRGWVGGSGEVLSTADGGATWSSRPAYIDSSGVPLTIGHSDARFVSEARGVMVGGFRGGGLIRTTTDGGVTWAHRVVNTNWMTGVAFGSASHWWAVGGGGRIVASADGGMTWVEQTSPVFEALSAVWAVSGTTAWAVGENGTVLRTSNGGATWVRLFGGT